MSSIQRGSIAALALSALAAGATTAGSIVSATYAARENAAPTGTQGKKIGLIMLSLILGLAALISFGVLGYNIYAWMK